MPRASRSAAAALLLLGAPPAAGAPVLPLPKDDGAVVREYLAAHRRFSARMCRPGVEKGFWERNRRYRDGGHYVPLLPDDRVDAGTIERGLPLLEEKIRWLGGVMEGLRRSRGFGPVLREARALKGEVRRLLALKEAFDEAPDGRRRERARLRSERALVKFGARVRSLAESVPFLHNFRFPVDHLALRGEYDRLKDRRDPEGRRRANGVYFLRKLVQDASHHPDGRRSDKFLRATIDSVHLRAGRPGSVLAEELRYDVLDLLGSLTRYLAGPGAKERILGRLGAWRDRLADQAALYRALLGGGGGEGGLVAGRVGAKEDLRSFVRERLAGTYRFWGAEPERLRALFVLSTILAGEVGSLDFPDGTYRRDVAQVVVNRRRMREYAEPGGGPLFGELRADGGPDPGGFPWLNVLFGEGEFSFTWFFITGNVRIYCPDMSPAGRRLRRENLRIALDVLRRPDDAFRAVRYFSRVSMLGRVSMDSLWTGHRAVPEREGSEVPDPEAVLRLIDRGRHTYLYRFANPSGRAFKAVSAGGREYAVPLDGRRDVRAHRDPHLFRFFVPAPPAPLFP